MPTSPVPVRGDADVTGNDATLSGGADIQSCGVTTVGGTIDVDIVVPSPGIPADGLVAFGFRLNYDPSVLELVGVDGDFLLGADGGTNVVSWDALDVDGELFIDVYDVNPAALDESGPGVLVRLTFEGVLAGTDTVTTQDFSLYTFDNPPNDPAIFPIVADPSATIAVDDTCAADFENLGASAIPATSPAGAGRVPIRNIPLEALPGLSGALPSAPLGSIPLGSIPLGSIPLGSIPLGSIMVNGSPLSSIPLSSIPLSSIGGWEAVLAGTALENMPPQALTLAMVQAEAPEVLTGPQAVTLSQVDLTASSLRGIGVGPLALGDLRLDEIPVPDGYATWCDPLPNNPPTVGYLETEFGFSCGSDVDSGLTTIGLHVRGAPLGSIPLGSIPLGSIPLGSIPLGSIPLGSIPLGSIPLGSIPLGSIPLGSINLAGTPLGSIPLGSIEVPDGSADWCTWLLAQGASYSCAALDIDDTDSMQDLVIALLETGSPLASTPLGSIPLGSIPLGSIPLGSIPLGSIPLGSIPWAALC
jgi:hypothetical protein